MDVGYLEEVVGRLVEASVAPSTRKTYLSGQRKYFSFCKGVQLSYLPLTEDKACLFVAYLVDSKLKHSTIKGYLSAVRRLQVVAGMGDPFAGSWPRLECALKGVKRAAAVSGVEARVRLPVTPKILKLLRSVWSGNSSGFDSVMLWAACCMCYFGFLRSGEVTVPSLKEYDGGAHLSEGDVSLDSVKSPKMVQVRVKQSKTDPFRKGVMVYLGRTGGELCPVAAVSAYLAVRGRAPGPFLVFKGGEPLSREIFVRRVRAALREVGVDSDKYAGHSFRIGAASTAAAVGVEDSLIQTLGRWKSSAYLSYVRVPRERLASVSNLIA